MDHEEHETGDEPDASGGRNCGGHGRVCRPGQRAVAARRGSAGEGTRPHDDRPALSETNGDYDGQFLFINDKINARVAVIDLRDWETKQIVKNPLTLSDHGGTFVTPNTDYIIEGGQYAVPWGADYAPISDYTDKAL